MELVRERNGSFCLLICHQKMPWKFLLKKNHTPTHPVVYGKIRQRCGMNEIKSGWLENLGTLKAVDSQLQSCRVRENNKARVFRHPMVSPKLYHALLRCQEAASPEGVRFREALHLTWDREQLLSVQAGTVTLTLIWEFCNTKVYPKHVFVKPQSIRIYFLYAMWRKVTCDKTNVCLF